MILLIVLLIDAMVLSGRIVNISESPSERLSPPMRLGFSRSKSRGEKTACPRMRPRSPGA